MTNRTVIQGVKNKVKNIMGDEGNVMVVARNLALPDMLLSSYLSTDGAAVRTLHETLSGTPIQRKDGEIRRALDAAEPDIPIKLVLLDTTVGHNKLPVLEDYPASTEKYTIALAVGKLLLTWNQWDLVVPRRFIGNMSFGCLTSDISPLGSLMTDDVMQKLADVICKWNTERSWKEESGSAADFVLSVLDHLNINVSPVLRNFVECYGNGRTQLEFFPSEECVEAFHCDSHLIFRNHCELDKWVRLHSPRIKSFKDDYRVLQAMDRMLWARWLDEYPPVDGTYGLQNINRAVPNENQMASLSANASKALPYHDNEEFRCPFKNPLLKGSLGSWTTS